MNGQPLQDAQKDAQKPILFFDGVCGLCNRFVDFVLRHDRRGVFLLAPLQGKTAERFLNRKDREDLDSVVLLLNGRPRYRSSAALRVIARLGGFWSLFGLFLLIPPPLRDWVYGLVARNRYRMFGKFETCRLPTPEERGRLLD